MMKRQCFANFLKADRKSEKVLGTYCHSKLMYCINSVRKPHFYDDNNKNTTRGYF